MNRTYIAMIPARLGSRRIPKKNIRYMLDKPLIQYPVDFALASKRFDSIWINTENRKLGELFIDKGVQYHERPIELAGDKATNRDFVYEFLKKHECDYVIMINPTSPTLRQDTVNRFMDYVDENEFDTVMSVISNQAEGFCRGAKINFDGKDKIPSDQLDPIEEIIWSITAWKRDTFIRLQESGECPVFGGKLGTFAIPKDEATDLDNEEDWKIAEGILIARNTENYEIKYLNLGD